MAILFMDGLDVYDDADSAAAVGWAYTGGSFNATFSKTAGRFGGGALVTPAALTSNFWQYAYPLANNTTYYYSFSLKASALASGAPERLFSILDIGASTLFLLSLTSAGTLRIANAAGTTTDSAVTNVIFGGIWCRIEIKFNAGTSTSTGSIEVRVNGTTVLNLTAQNYFSSSGGALARFYNNNASSTSDRTFDDIVLNDTTSAVNNSWLGDVRIDTLQPTADTAQADWTKSAGTSGFALIDDTLGAADGDSTYLSSNTVGNKSEFAIADLGSASASIFALQMRTKSERAGLSARTYRTYLKSSAAVSNGPTLQASAFAYCWAFNGIVNTDPNTSAAWDDAGVNAVNLGLELVA